MSKTKTYAVLSNLRHDGTLYEAGDTVELTDEQAAALLPINVVKLATQQPASENPSPPADDDLSPDLKIPEIKEKLDAAGIKYPSGANKATLLALLPVEGQ